MAVVEARDVVEEGVLEERMAVDGVHDEVEGGEGGEGGEEEGDAGFVEEGGQVLEDCSAFGGWWAGWGAGLQCPQDADAVDEWVDLEVDAQAEEDAGEADVSHFDGPEQCHDHGAKETLAAASCADSRNHWVQQPDARIPQCCLLAQTTSLQHRQYQPPGNNVRYREEHFA